jgi:hypothetical protein
MVRNVPINITVTVSAFSFSDEHESDRKLANLSWRNAQHAGDLICGQKFLKR